MYTWLLGVLEREYETVRVLKETPRSSVHLIRHRASGERLILRRFRGNGEVYRQLLGLACKNLPVIYEAAEQDGENLVLEEFIEGDTLDFLCDYYAYDGTYQDSYYLGEPMTVTDNMVISNVDVGEGAVRMTYRLTDQYHQYHWTPALEF